MTYSYEFDITSFAGDVDPSELGDEIRNSVIVPTFHHVTVHGDVYNIIFNSELSEAEEDILTDIVAAHSEGETTQYSHTVKLLPSVDLVNTDLYMKVSSFTYPGKNHTEIIEKIFVIAYMDVGITDYTIQVSDETNGNVIAEKTFNNTGENVILDMGTISNIPSNQSIIEFAVKKNGGDSDDYVHLESITIYYV